mgnify:CR=1 FL=1
MSLLGGIETVFVCFQGGGKKADTIEIDCMSRLKRISGERNLYQAPNGGTYYVRIFHGGKDTFRSLETTRLREARERMDTRRAAMAAAKLGLALEPDDAFRQVTVAQVIERYVGDGYLDKRGRKRTCFAADESYCRKLLEYFGNGVRVDDLCQNVLDQYHDWRLENAQKGIGHRATDLERTTLSNALGWAVRKQVVETNPIKSRSCYHCPNESRHCRECAPADMDELQEIARLLFSDKRSETLGWQVLFEGMTGLRTNEILSLRLDSRPDEPGGITEDGRSMCVRRSKKPGRDNPYVLIHEGLKPFIAAHRQWHQKRYPQSPCYFPGRNVGEDQPVYKCALTRALDRLFKEKKLKRKFTSHGMRAFYVLVRRSQGIGDAHIAWEINHVGGVTTLEKVYGGIPPHWLQGQGPKLSWIPKGEVAWASIV